VENSLAALKKAGVPVLTYGNFITTSIDVAILAFIIFMMPANIDPSRCIPWIGQDRRWDVMPLPPAAAS
jgi:hypothetical protein